MRLKNLFTLSWFLTLLFCFAPLPLFALEIKRLPGIPVRNDILLSPARVELSLDPGDRSVRYLNIVNRTGKDVAFKLSIEDFSPSDDPRGGVVLDKTIAGIRSSLKEYISVDSSQFILAHGEQARIPVTVLIHKDVRPGGLYAAVIISSAPLKESSGAAKVVTRLGALFFVKVNGTVKHSAVLKGATFLDDKIEIVFENNGDVYLDPYGTIDIYDRFKKLISKINIDPWFVLPRSTRSRMVALPVSDLSVGRYTASISMNRGYDDIVDNKELTFERSSPVDNRTKIFLILASVVVISLLYRYFL